MQVYARAKYAFGFCDRTGFRYPLKDLVYEVRDGVRTGMRVGRDVFDPDQPQNFLGRVNISDPQSLFDPRPDHFIEGAFIQWPLLNEETLNPQRCVEAAVGHIGEVTVTV
jgi:hypothetical protein|tara:strand:+ start:179 stop:508 length:330 start_codon:yes stop_codon:yes gene_type:complete